MKRDYIHGCHGETSAIDHAPNIAVQGDVVEIEFGSGHLLLVFLSPVTKSEEFLLAELGVVVESELGVQGEI